MSTPIQARLKAKQIQLVAASPAAGRWSAEQIPLLVLAMYHVVVGYFTFAPFYRDLGGDELLGDAALEAQTRFLRELVGRLFGAGENPGLLRGTR